MDATLRLLLSVIPRSKATGTTMKKLGARIGVTDDHELREMVKTLREDYGHFIVAFPTRGGVWITDDPDVWREWIAIQTSRARELEHSIRVATRMLPGLDYTGTLFDVEQVA